MFVGRGKPGWGRESTRPPWWPKELPWANVRMDARSEEEKQKVSNILLMNLFRIILTSGMAKNAGSDQIQILKKLSVLMRHLNVECFGCVVDFVDSRPAADRYKLL